MATKKCEDRLHFFAFFYGSVASFSVTQIFGDGVTVCLQQLLQTFLRQQTFGVIGIHEANGRAQIVIVFCIQATVEILRRHDNPAFIYAVQIEILQMIAVASACLGDGSFVCCVDDDKVQITI